MISIDKIYCINLDRRPDRWLQVSDQFKMNGLEVKRFPAIDGRTLEYDDPKESANAGCTLSHRAVLWEAANAGYHVIMVFEDDAVLHENFSDLLKECLNAVPDDWDILYLGGSHRQEPTKVNERIFKVTKTLTTHGYLINTRIMMHELMWDMCNPTMPVDCYFAALQTLSNCYITDPPLAWQRAGFSDIQGREMNYDWIRSNVQ